MTDYRLRRIYDEPHVGDGFRVLADRLWPRGVRKDAVALDLWARDVAPSHELRKAFGRDGDFEAFRAAYAAELEAGGGLDDLLERISGQETVTLLTAMKDLQSSKLVILRDALLDAEQHPRPPLC